MDHKLKIFKEVAITGSFSRAAENMHVSQPAISKTIRNLETFYGKALFERKINHIELTEAGKVLLKYTERLLSLYDQLADELSEDKTDMPDEIKIGASTTIANYILPRLISRLQRDYPRLRINLITGNTNEIQQLLLAKKIDFGIVEGQNQNTRIHYERFVYDELVLVTSARNMTVKTPVISPEALKTLSFVCREPGSGTREVIENTLAEEGIGNRIIHSTLGSTESIKSYLCYSDDFAFISIHALNQELTASKLKTVEVENFKITRWFHFITRQGYQSKLSSRLKKLLIRAYNQTL